MQRTMFTIKTARGHPERSWPKAKSIATTTIWTKDWMNISTGITEWSRLRNKLELTCKVSFAFIEPIFGIWSKAAGRFCSTFRAKMAYSRPKSCTIPSTWIAYASFMLMPSKKRDNLCIIDNLCVFLITCAFLITSSFLITWIILITRLDGFFEMTSIEITEFKVRVVVEDSYEIVPSKPDTDVAAVLEFLLKQLGTNTLICSPFRTFPC